MSLALSPIQVTVHISFGEITRRDDRCPKTFGPTDLTSTYSVCTRRVFGGIGPKPSGLEFDGLTTMLPTALKQ
ncbi:hypothetical protein TNCV_3166901 [Trichonephila clavipes]|uniref:Uncharacterized protein n=1 Tax=Trichonephila clavipes TaxID=2585209 RepID=A0A8X6RE27_TRICX|nr:hypothetical protein TNCV_3166901 [Trichonephila clavipes]